MRPQWPAAGALKFRSSIFERRWRSLRETAANFRNAHISEQNRVTCDLIDTTSVYHQQSKVGYRYGGHILSDLKGWQKYNKFRENDEYIG
jgi:hypothetical protein